MDVYPSATHNTATRQRDRLHAREGGGVQLEGAQFRQVYPSALSTLLRFSDSAVWQLQLSPPSVTVSSAGTTPHMRFPFLRESSTSSPSLAVLRPSCSVVSAGFFRNFTVAFAKQLFWAVKEASEDRLATITESVVPKLFPLSTTDCR